MSPWGGYSKPKQERIAFGKSAGYEIVGGGYALSGPKYYAAFRDVALEMIEKYGVNQFKFDGTGNVDSVFPGSRFDSDFSAMIQSDWRIARSQAGSLHQPDDGHVAFAVLADACGLDLAWWRG